MHAIVHFGGHQTVIGLYDHNSAPLYPTFVVQVLLSKTPSSNYNRCRISMYALSTRKSIRIKRHRLFSATSPSAFQVITFLEMREGV